MTESEYIIATNRAKISAALTIVRDVLPGKEWGVLEAEIQQVARLLTTAESRLFSMIETAQKD